MFLTSPPIPAKLTELFADWSSAPFSYPASSVGRTRDGGTVPGYTVDRHRVVVGHGERYFERAVAALREWRMFDIKWLHLLGADVIEPGRVVAVMPRHFGVYSLNPCRVIYVIDEESNGARRFGFGYGTLPEHVERGEERFVIEWQHSTDYVRYDILACSRPRHPLLWLGYPVGRWFQRRFAHDSKSAMLRALA